MSKTSKTTKTNKRESLRRVRVLLSRIKAQQGQLSLLEGLELNEEERRTVEELKRELRELQQDAESHINLLRER